MLEPALAAVLDPVPGIEYELMPDTHGVGAPEVLDRYDAVIALDYRFRQRASLASSGWRFWHAGESATIRSTWRPVRKPVSFSRSRRTRYGGPSPRVFSP